MIPASERFYNPDGPDRVAEVAVQRAADPDLYLIQVRRGPRAANLRALLPQGPYTEAQLPAQFSQTVQDLRAEGFWPAGLHALLTALADERIAARARAAARLGWRRSQEAVDGLLSLLPSAVDETCAILDALGAIGDPRAIPALRQHAERKLLSRRRSAVEALRNLRDEQGLQQASVRALERLPPSLREKGETLHEPPGEERVETLLQDVLAVEQQQQGLAVDTLYELATPLVVAVVRRVLEQLPFDAASVWRYVKSVHKRALLRHDFETFGWLSHAIEAQARASKGIVATVKSGHDGVQRSTRIFSKATQDYLRRLGWRYLRNLARYRPGWYAHAAAEALIHYNPADAQHPSGPHPSFARCYLLHRILYGGGTRFEFVARQMRFVARKAKPPAGVREEAFPHLWDAQPRAYLRVLSAARLAEAHVFALRALTTTHRDLIHSATPAELVGMLRAPYEPTVELALRELERRFDPAAPDWPLVTQLVCDDRPLALQIGQKWLRLTAPLWTRDAGKTLSFLAAGHPTTRDLVLELTREPLSQDAPLRQALAELALSALRQSEGKAGAHEALSRLVRQSLAGEVSALLSVEQMADWITWGTPDAKALAAALLGARPEAVMQLGLERLTALAQHEIAAVRAAAHTLLRMAGAALRADPSVLFVLIESEWEDTRGAALDLLRTQIDPITLGLDGLMGLLDSNRPAVQALGRELAAKHLAELPAEELVYRLVQHPHPSMRRFALQLVVEHLPAGDGPLGKLKEFCRAAMLDLWPQREVKQKVVEFLRDRGLEDPRQAALVTAILGDLVRLQGRADFERALEALVRIKMKYPDVPSTVKVMPGGVA